MRKQRSLLMAGFLGVVLLPSLLSAGSHAIKIGFVNINLVFEQSAMARRAKEKLKKGFAHQQDKVARLRAQLIQLDEALHPARKKPGKPSYPDLSEDIGDDATRELRRKKHLLILELQYAERMFNEAFNMRGNEERAKVQNQLNETIKKIAIAGQYDLIVQDALWHNSQIDITDRVVKALR